MSSILQLSFESQAGVWAHDPKPSRASDIAGASQFEVELRQANDPRDQALIQALAGFRRGEGPSGYHDRVAQVKRLVRNRLDRLDAEVLRNASSQPQERLSAWLNQKYPDLSVKAVCWDDAVLVRELTPIKAWFYDHAEHKNQPFGYLSAWHHVDAETQCLWDRLDVITPRHYNCIVEDEGSQYQLVEIPTYKNGQVQMVDRTIWEKLPYRINTSPSGS